MTLWLVDGGMLEQRREEFVLPSGAVPARALQGALETISLQSLSALGVVLLGRLERAEGMVVAFSDDVAENIRFADEASATSRRRIDNYIARAGIKAPDATDDPAEVVAAKVPSPPITSLDLKANGIGTIIWCTGFYGDFSWLKVAGAIGTDQQPCHVNGIGAASGLYFPGLDFASTPQIGDGPRGHRRSSYDGDAYPWTPWPRVRAINVRYGSAAQWSASRRRGLFQHNPPRPDVLDCSQGTSRRF